MKKLLAMMLLCAASLCAMGQTTQRATQFLAGNGSCGTPGFAFQGGTNDGLFWDSGNARVTVCVGGVDVMDISASLATLRTVTIKGIEQAAPAGVAGSDMLYPDSTAHRWKVNDNNGGAKTLAELETAQTWTALQQFSSGISSDGTHTAIIPAAADTLVGKATTDVFTGKTYDTAGAGNVFKINGTTVNEAIGILSWGCTGTAAAGATVVPFWGSTCGSATGAQIPITSGTVKNLFCHSNVGGVNASSGIVTVRKGGVSQAITCTFGTTLACNDTTHSVTTVNGDLVDIIFTTQAAETLNQVVCTLEKF